MLAVHKRALSEVMAPELIAKNDEAFSGKSKEFGHQKIKLSKNLNITLHTSKFPFKKIEAVTTGMSRSQVSSYN